MTESELPPELFETIEYLRQQARDARVPIQLPPELEKVRQYTRRAIDPIKPADDNTEAEREFLFAASRMDASDGLPPYYLVFFLLVDLLGFRNLGRFEKIAWSVPIDFEGKAYLIEHHKFGLGVFARKGEEESAARIVALIKKGVKVSQPFFKWMAEEAIRASKFNIVNNAPILFGRYQYMRELYLSALEKQERVKEEFEEDKKQRRFHLWRRSSSGNSMIGDPVWINPRDWEKLTEHVNWLALGTIDAFFGWTEHIFIHLAVLQGRVTTGKEVAQLVGSDWNIKFKTAFDINNKDDKLHLDKMIAIRQQLRNFVAHGAFGKEGEAFHFHSRAGAVPVVFDSTQLKNRFSLTETLGFNNAEALASIEEFIKHLWSGKREPARYHIQESSGLPSVLTMATDGQYATAMQSVGNMEEFVSHMLDRNDAHSNMDW